MHLSQVAFVVGNYGHEIFLGLFVVYVGHDEICSEAIVGYCFDLIETSKKDNAQSVQVVELIR